MSAESEGSQRRPSAAGRFGTLLYPGMVAIIGFAPTGLLGPLAFAIREDMSFPTSVIGLTFALYFVASAATSSLGTQILSRMKASRVVRIGLGLSSLLCLAMAFAPSSGYAVAVSIAAGLVNGAATPATNIVLVQTVPLHRHGLGFGVKVASIPVASSVAAFAAYLVTVTDLSWRSFFVAFGLLGLAILGVVMLLRARRDQPRTRSVPIPRTGRPDRAMLLLAASGLLAANGTSFYTAFLVDSLIDSGLAAGLAAIIVGVVGWLGILARVSVGAGADRSSDPRTHLRAIIVILLIAGAGMAGLAFGSGVLLLAASTFACFCIGWAWPGLMHHAAIELFPASKSLATSYVQTANYTGTVLGSLLFGFVAEHVSFTAAWITPICSVVLAAALLLVVGRELGGRSRLSPA